MLECSPMSLRATKQAAMQGLAVPDVSMAMKVEYEAVARLRTSQDWVEGPLAFAQKRKPDWKLE
jgi:crotonobetainyl-CoA hydratase